MSHLNKASLSHEYLETESLTRLVWRGRGRDRQVYSLTKLHRVLDCPVREGGWGGGGAVWAV